MIVLYGTKGCAKCKMTQRILQEKKIEHEYKDFNLLSEDEQEWLLRLASIAHVSSFPILMEHGEVIKEIPEK